MKINILKCWLAAVLFACVGIFSANAGEIFAYDEKGFSLMPPVEDFVYDEMEFSLMPPAEDFAWDEKTFWLMPDERPLPPEIIEPFGPNAEIESQVDDYGNVTNYLVRVTNDISGTITLPDNLGPVTVDVNGHTIFGADGANGSGTVAGQDGTNAIVIVRSDGEGSATVVTIVDSTGTDNVDVRGGNGGDGNPAGNGAAAIKVADDARDGVRINVGEDVVIKGGDGGEGLGNDENGNGTNGGNGGAGVDGDVGDNEGTITGGQGGNGGNASGDGQGGQGGNGGAAIDPATTGGDEPAGDGTETGGNGGKGGDGVIPGDGGHGGAGTIPGEDGKSGQGTDSGVESAVITAFANGSTSVTITVKIGFKSGVDVAKAFPKAVTELVVIRAETVDGFAKGEIATPQYTVRDSDPTAKTVTVEVAKPADKSCGFYKVAFGVVGDNN